MVTPSRKTRVGAIVQTRVSSKRLPGKVLLPLPCNSGVSVCEHIIRRLKKVKNIDSIIIATTSNVADDKIVDIADADGVAYYRGVEQDVLSRFFEAARKHRLDEIIRLTGDNPCIDSSLIDKIIQVHLRENNDYTVTMQYPIGLDVEILSFKALRWAHEKAKLPAEREHVARCIDAHSETFRISEKKAPKKHQHPGIRVTLDTPEDYALLNCVFEFLYPEDNYFDIEKLILLYRERPWLTAINNRVVQKRVFDSLEDELREAVRVLDLQELNRARELIEKHIQ